MHPALILVRHAMPAVDPAVPSHRWRLGADGRTAAARLRLPAGAVLVASDEPKAAETLRYATGREPAADSGFAEVRRNTGWDPDHAALARAYVNGTDHPGWEPRTAVVARFDAALRRHTTPGRTLVVGTHGMAMTCWLTAAGHVPGPPGDFWAALDFPHRLDVGLPR